MKQNENKKTEGVSESIATLLSWVLMIFSGICIFMVFVVLPFYSREGYRHLGNDKAYLLSTTSFRMGKLLLPVFGLWLFFRVLQIVLDYCEDLKWDIGNYPQNKADSDVHRNKAVGLLHRFRNVLHASATDRFAFFFALSAFLSYVCSEYRLTALWGTEGWYMGMLTQLTFVSIYILVSRFTFDKFAKWMLYLGLLVSAVVFLLGILNRFDIWPLHMVDYGVPIFISTIGNINWYCCYTVTLLFTGVGLFWMDFGVKKWHKILLAAYVFIGMVTLITQGSESGIFAMALVFAVLFVLSAFSGDEKKLCRFWQLVMLLGVSGLLVWLLRILFPGRMNYTSRMGKVIYSPISIVVLVIAVGGYFFAKRYCTIGETVDDAGKTETGAAGAFGRGTMRIAAKTAIIAIIVGLMVIVGMIILNTLHPGSLGVLSSNPLFIFNNKWGSSRGASWMLGIRCFMEQDLLHKLVGVGPDCMVDFLYSGASTNLQDAAGKAFTSGRLTNAHCEWLTILVDMGILGLITYAGMWISLLKCLLFSAKDKMRDASFATACGVGALAYLLNNIWSFQQSVGTAVVFAVMGFGVYFAACRNSQ